MMVGSRLTTHDQCGQNPAYAHASFKSKNIPIKALMHVTNQIFEKEIVLPYLQDQFKTIFMHHHTSINIILLHFTVHSAVL